MERGKWMAELGSVGNWVSSRCWQVLFCRCLSQIVEG